MRTLAELSQYYNSELLPELTKLEQERVEAVNKIFIIIGPLALLTIGFAIFATNISQDLSGWVLMGGFVSCTIIYFYLTKNYVGEFKDKIILSIIRFIEPGLVYTKSSFIAKRLFDHSEVFSISPNIYRGDDLVTGTVGATAVEFSEILAQHETGSGKNRRVRTIFKGLFFIGDFNKHFMGRTFVLPDKAERLFGNLGSFLQQMAVSRPPLVKLEDPDFEREFVVYGDDQIEARYILSTSLMKRILEFKQKCGRPVYLAFKDSKVYIAITYFKDLFEPRIFNTILDFGSIQEYFEDLQLAIGVVDELNLNTRIWTKQ